MGNCLRREASGKHWAGEDWGFLATQEESDKLYKQPAKMEENSLLRGEDVGFSSSSSSSSSSTLGSAVTEVKIKITKKQLEELLGKVDIKELSVHQVLTRLINVGDHIDQSNQRAWSPGLQSIPEVN